MNNLEENNDGWWHFAFGNRNFRAFDYVRQSSRRTILQIHNLSNFRSCFIGCRDQSRSLVLVRNALLVANSEHFACSFSALRFAVIVAPESGVARTASGDFIWNFRLCRRFSFSSSLANREIRFQSGTATDETKSASPGCRRTLADTNRWRKRRAQ